MKVSWVLLRVRKQGGQQKEKSLTQDSRTGGAGAPFQDRWGGPPFQGRRGGPFQGRWGSPFQGRWGGPLSRAGWGVPSRAGEVGAVPSKTGDSHRVLETPPQRKGSTNGEVAL